MDAGPQTRQCRTVELQPQKGRRGRAREIRGALRARRQVAAKFTHGNGGGVATDKLVFTLSDGRGYEWRSNHPISTVGGYRYDFQRYAIFCVAGVGLQLVADDAPWNGDPVENAEALTIHARGVDHAMVMATLQMMNDAQWEEVLRVRKTVKQARKTEMEKLVY